MIDFSKRIVGAVALAGTLAASLPAAWAGDQAAPRPATSEEETGRSSWRRHAFPLALAGAGLGLGLGITLKVVSNQRADEFNEHANRGCRSNAPDHGAPGCTGLLESAQSANRWAMVGFAAAGVFGVTALILKLTEPASETTAAQASRPRLACAPGAGLSATCLVTF
jgi:hypothetical protein